MAVPVTNPLLILHPGIEDQPCVKIDYLNIRQKFGNPIGLLFMKIPDTFLERRPLETLSSLITQSAIDAITRVIWPKLQSIHDDA